MDGFAASQLVAACTWYAVMLAPFAGKIPVATVRYSRFGSAPADAAR